MPPAHAVLAHSGRQIAVHIDMDGTRQMAFTPQALAGFPIVETRTAIQHHGGLEARHRQLGHQLAGIDQGRLALVRHQQR